MSPNQERKETGGPTATRQLGVGNALRHSSCARAGEGMAAQDHLLDFPAGGRLKGMLA